MTTLHRLTRLAALPLAAGLLVACGGGDGDSSGDGGGEASGGDYCAELADAKTTLEGFGGQETGPEEVEQFFSTMHDLADAAPSEIESQWQQIDTSITDLEDAIEQSGIDLAQFAEVQQGGQLPEGVTQEDLQSVLTAAQDFASEANSEAFDAIEEHGEAECDVDLGGDDSSDAPSDDASDDASEDADN